MPSAPPSPSPTAIPMAATRTVATACVALPSQAATAPQNRASLMYPLHSRGVPVTTDANATQTMKTNGPRPPFVPRKQQSWSIGAVERPDCIKKYSNLNIFYTFRFAEYF